MHLFKKETIQQDIEDSGILYQIDEPRSAREQARNAILNLAQNISCNFLTRISDAYAPKEAEGISQEMGFLIELISDPDATEGIRLAALEAKDFVRMVADDLTHQDDQEAYLKDAVDFFEDIAQEIWNLPRLGAFKAPEPKLIVGFYISDSPMNEDIDGSPGYKRITWRAGPFLKNFRMENFGFGGVSDPCILAYKEQTEALAFLNKISRFDHSESYAFKIVFSDGEIIFLRGLVLGPIAIPSLKPDEDLDRYRLDKNFPEGFSQFTIGLQQPPLICAP